MTDDGQGASRSISTIEGIFLFSSTIIGAGILALPVVAFEEGSLPFAAMILCMAPVSFFSECYVAEALIAAHESLYLPARANKYLGAWGNTTMLFGKIPSGNRASSGHICPALGVRKHP